MSQREIYRVIDANANRAREGLRVVEEVTRFILEEPQFTARLKEIRHRITDALKGFPTQELLSARNSREDVGRELYQPEEGRRDDFRSVIRANTVRSQEALRTLEEFSKVIDSRIGEKFKAFRFQLYSLEKELNQRIALSHRRWAVENWKLYVVLDRKLIGDNNPLQAAKAAARGGAQVIQWRDKEGSSREAFKVISQLKGCKELRDIAIIINDRVDIALTAGADGVHLGQDDIPPLEARKLLGGKIMGLSTHNKEEAVRAEKEGADYISLGPIFPTETKKDTSSPLGVKKIKEVKENIEVPLVAIGGINETNIVEVAAAGADVAAVASAILKAKDITAATKDLLNRFKKIS